MVVKKGKRRVIGIEVGNGMVKIRSLDAKTGLVYLEVLPSAWAYAKDVAKNSVSDESLQLDVYTIDGVEYVWGKDIGEVDNYKLTYGHENRYRTEQFKIMAKIAMARAVRDLDIHPNEKLLISTNIPSGESTNVEKEEEIISAFMGEVEGFHEVTVNEDEYTFKVFKVEVLSQALATVVGRYLDAQGYVGDEEYENLKVGVIDIGNGTTDLDVIYKLRRLNIFKSIPKGFKDVYTSIGKEINKKYPSHEVKDLKLLKQIKDKDFSYVTGRLRDPIDISKPYKLGLDELVVDIQSSVMTQWKDQSDFDEILLVGASAPSFEEMLKNVVTGLTIPKNYETSNVEGCYRWGMYILMVEGEE